MQPLWQPAYVALGSNLQQPLQQVQSALAALHALPQVACITASSLYRSAPMGRTDQPEFINAVAGFVTTLKAESLLQALMRIEQSMGRVRTEHWGPRVIDLDLLLLGATKSDTPELQLPHPGMLSRNFVLLPLAEIAPQLWLPGGTAQQWAERLGHAGIERRL